MSGVESLAKSVQSALLPVSTRIDWVVRCLEEMIVNGDNPLGSEESAVVRYVYEHAMHNDIRAWAAARPLPECTQTGEKLGKLVGPTLLQVDEVVNVGASADKRFDDTKSRVLKLCLCDGFVQAFAVELQSVPDLSVYSFAGAKIIVRDAPIRRGLVLLTPRNTLVLGGAVPALVYYQYAVIAYLKEVQRRIAVLDAAATDAPSVAAAAASAASGSTSAGAEAAGMGIEAAGGGSGPDPIIAQRPSSSASRPGALGSPGARAPPSGGAYAGPGNDGDDLRDLFEAAYEAEGDMLEVNDDEWELAMAAESVGMTDGAAERASGPPSAKQQPMSGILGSRGAPLSSKLITEASNGSGSSSRSGAAGMTAATASEPLNTSVVVDLDPDEEGMGGKGVHGGPGVGGTRQRKTSVSVVDRLGLGRAAEAGPRYGVGAAAAFVYEEGEPGLAAAGGGGAGRAVHLGRIGRHQMRLAEDTIGARPPAGGNDSDSSDGVEMVIPGGDVAPKGEGWREELVGKSASGSGGVSGHSSSEQKSVGASGISSLQALSAGLLSGGTASVRVGVVAVQRLASTLKYRGSRFGLRVRLAQVRAVLDGASSSSSGTYVGGVLLDGLDAVVSHSWIETRLGCSPPELAAHLQKAGKTCSREERHRQKANRKLWKQRVVQLGDEVQGFVGSIGLRRAAPGELGEAEASGELDSSTTGLSSGSPSQVSAATEASGSQDQRPGDRSGSSGLGGAAWVVQEFHPLRAGLEGEAGVVYLLQALKDAEMADEGGDG